MPAGTDQNLLYEFNANWGNRAIGQAAALTATRTPGGTPVNGLTGLGITIAVIDSGIDAVFAGTDPAAGFSRVHPEFQGRLDTRSRAFLTNGTQSLAIIDTDGHGTHVAGTAAAARDGAGMLGVAPEAQIVALKGVGRGFDADAALAYAASLPDVRVINGSYGPSSTAADRTWTTGNLDAEIAAVRSALTAGKVLVYAAGNDYETNPTVARNPTGVAVFPYIRPANARTGVYDDEGRNYDFSDLARLPGSIIAVTNLDTTLRISPNSNRCGVAAHWCVSAPGGGAASAPDSIVSAYPNIGTDIVTGPTPGAIYHYTAGTSMAAPHVTGVFAVLFQAFPTYSTQDVVRLLFATAQDLGDPGIDEIYGRGLVRLDRALAAPTLSPTAATNTATVAPGETQFWSAPATAAGSLTVAGSGTPAVRGTRSATTPADAASELVVAGRVTLAGAVDASAVDIEIDGTLATPRLSIGRDAMLSGEGDIFGNVDVQGVLSPGSGNSGDLVVHGNLTLGREATFHAVIDGSEAADGYVGYSIAVVTGAGHTFSAAGALVFDFVGIDGKTVLAPIGTKFPVVLAEDGARMQGRFESLSVVSETGMTGLPAASRLDVLYSSTAIVGAVTPAAYANLEANGVALTGRQRALAGALDRARGEPGAILSDRALSVFDPLFGATPAQMPQIFDQLSGAGSSATAQAAVDASRRFTGMLGERMSALRSGAAPVQSLFAPSLATATTGLTGLYIPPTAFAATTRYAGGDGPAGAIALAGTEPAVAGAWGLGFGNAFRIGADASGPGLRAQGGGVMLGVDRAIDPGLFVGGAFGYARSNVASAGVRGDADTYLGAAYLGLKRGGFEIDAAAGLAYAAMDSSRAFAPFGTPLSARGRSDGLGALASVEIGYRFAIPSEGGVLSLKPLAAFAYNDLHRSAFAETGGGGFGLAFAGQTFGRATSLVGLAAGMEIALADGLRIRPDLRIGWTHDVMGSSPLVRASFLDQPFRVRDARAGRDGFLANADVTAWITRTTGLFVGYRGEVQANATSHQGHAGLRIVW
ncbi:S8 family peptidase [Methylobacterium sp. sgz302541]|uniref:S8 family peptidase n=1 Tax=unclassified Methylobacterium TaxID=2615210 RepID=UPI003D32C770